MMKVLILSLAVCIYVAYATPAQVVKFADEHWDCANAACTRRVHAGEYQPDYQCAEFVSRSLAAGGYIPGLHGNESQSRFLNYHHNGKTYDLLWVSHKQGGPLGLEDLLIVLGWKNVGKSASSIEAASAIMCVGADGPYSHTAVGVGHDVTDAHNMARYHVPGSAYLGIDAIYHPPN